MLYWAKPSVVGAASALVADEASSGVELEATRAKAKQSLVKRGKAKKVSDQRKGAATELEEVLSATANVGASPTPRLTFDDASEAAVEKKAGLELPGGAGGTGAVFAGVSGPTPLTGAGHALPCYGYEDMDRGFFRGAIKCPLTRIGCICFLKSP